jgi:hypothetical protein
MHKLPSGRGRGRGRVVVAQNKRQKFLHALRLKGPAALTWRAHLTHGTQGSIFLNWELDTTGDEMLSKEGWGLGWWLVGGCCVCWVAVVALTASTCVCCVGDCWRVRLLMGGRTR